MVAAGSSKKPLKLTKNQTKRKYWSPRCTPGGIQAEQPQVVEEPNKAGPHPAQPAALAPVAAAVQQPMI